MLEVLESGAWTPSCAAHLLNRAAFGGTPAEIEALHQRGLQEAVVSLLDQSDDSDLFPVPELTPVSELRAADLAMKAMTPEQRLAEQKKLRAVHREQMKQLRQWWLERMRWSPWAAREKAVLFWHGHWATSEEKVRVAVLLWQQNETFRELAFGSFRELALAMTRDPAMMRYLDLAQSNPKHPNENFARELMELFTMGEGNYSEDDVQQAARAFTGYRLEPGTGKFRFVSKNHDAGSKTVFGKTGNFTGDDIVGLILERPETARFLSRKLWIYYAGTVPSRELVDALAEAFRSGGYDVGSLLRRIFLSREFYSPSVVRQQIKSPVQWLVGSCRVLEIPLPAPGASESILQQLGQKLFAPPNVKGWDGGRTWISSSTLLMRYNLSAALVGGKEGKGGLVTHTSPDLQSVCPAGQKPDDLISSVSWRLFQEPAPPALVEKAVAYLQTHGDSDGARRDLLHLMMSTPDYQLT